MRSVMIAASLAAALTSVTPMAFGPLTGAHAQGVEVTFLRARVNAITPSCRANPQAPIVGRVSGKSAGFGERSLSFVGCFDTARACEIWRGQALNAIRGRIVQNSCGARHG